MNISELKTTLKTGWALLAVSLPLGLTLELLHGFKVPAYENSEMRRELWRLAHAHGTLLGMLCLLFVALAPHHVPQSLHRPVGRLFSIGAVLMPIGFFAGGILNTEGDPSLAILLVPAGAVTLIAGLMRLAFNRE